jgi:stage III sporulation protein AC
MPSEYSSGNDGKPAFSDSDVLAATEERGETMDVNLIFRIAAVGILVSVICQVLKHSGRDEQAFLTSLAGLVLVLFWMVPYIYDLFETMKRLFLL